MSMRKSGEKKSLATDVRPKTADEWIAEGKEFDPQLHFTYTEDDQEIVDTLVNPYWGYVVAYYLCLAIGPGTFSLQLQFPGEYEKQMYELLNRYQAIPVTMTPKKRRTILAKIMADNERLCPQK